MSWGLFVQILVLMLIGGFIIAFNMRISQEIKDRSFFSRIAAIGEAMKHYSEDMTARQADERKKIIGELMEKILKKEENNDKRGS